jgi:hypothetical protein
VGKTARVFRVPLSTNFHGRQDCVTRCRIFKTIRRQMAALEGCTAELTDKS